jgi:hypothetical protein
MNGDSEKKLVLPGSSYDVVAKILHAYALCGDDPANLEIVAGKAAMDKTLVSRNHGFLVSLNLLSDGKAKILTPEGRKLAIAIGNNLEEDAAVEWRRVFLTAPAVKSVVDMLKVQKEIPTGTLPGKIAAALGLAGSSSVTTGVNSLVEVFEKAGVIQEQDGKYKLVPTHASFYTTTPENGEADAMAKPSVTQKVVSEDPSPPSPMIPKIGTMPIHVNIELHLPASSEQEVYDALFKSIRDNLLV